LCASVSIRHSLESPSHLSFSALSPHHLMMQSRLPSPSSQSTRPRIEWKQLAKLIIAIRGAYHHSGRAEDIIYGYKALLKPPWCSTLGIGAQYAIHNRIESAYRNIIKEQQTRPAKRNSKPGQLRNTRTELLVPNILSPQYCVVPADQDTLCLL